MTDHMLVQARQSADWRPRAACRDVDPELFFPIGSGGPSIAQAEQAVLVCRRCDVTAQCLDWALEHRQDAGVWGATTEEQRRPLLRRRSGPLPGSSVR